MTRKVYRAALLLFLNLSAAPVASALFYGYEVPIAELRSVVGFAPSVGPSPLERCSAVRLAPKFFLTAAHCFDFRQRLWRASVSNNMNQVSLPIGLGQGGENNGFQFVETKILEVYVFPGFDLDRVENNTSGMDVAIFTTQDDLTSPDVSYIAQGGLQKGQEVYLTGYGNLSRFKCVRGDAEINRVWENQFRTHRRQEGHAMTAFGDSGAPVFERRADGSVGGILGVASWVRSPGLSFGNPVTQTLSYFVRADRFEDWVNLVMSGQVAPSLRTVEAQPLAP